MIEYGDGCFGCCELFGNGLGVDFEVVEVRC